MPTPRLPLNDTDFWYVRNLLGIALPLSLAVYGVYSLVTSRSYTLWSARLHVWFVPVEGRQAHLMGVVFLGLALMFFAQCYAQYHEKMGFYCEWLLAPGALLAGVAIFWCAWPFAFGQN